MDVMEAIQSRRSIRKYQAKPVEQDKIGQIIEAGRATPSSGNVQNWKFIIVIDEHKRKDIAKASLDQEWMVHAPVHMVILSDPDAAKGMYGLRGERLYAVQNCAAAATNMMLTAHSLGLGSCWVGAFDEEKISRIVEAKDEHRPQIIITIGYAAETPDIPPRSKFDTVAFINKWMGRIKDYDSWLGNTGAQVRSSLEKGKGLVKKFHDKLKGKE